jgi:lauroyl/myristoyl acyltransferase
MARAGRDAIPVRTRPSRDASLSYYVFRLVEAVVSRLPRAGAYALAGVLGPLFWRLRPARFALLRENLSHAAPGLSPAEMDALMRRNVANLARSWVDVMQLRRQTAVMSRYLHAEGIPHLNSLVEEGNGVIAISMHLGCWEAGLSLGTSSGAYTALLAERLRPERLFKRMSAAREGMGLHIIPLDVAAIRAADPETARRLGAGATREIIRALKRGGVVAIAIDRDLIGNGAPVPFFGAPASIPTGAVEMAMRTGAALVPVALLRDGLHVRGAVYPRVAYDTAAPREAEVLRVTREILALFEGIIRDHPDQWHVLDRVWPESDAGTGATANNRVA